MKGHSEFMQKVILDFYNSVILSGDARLLRVGVEGPAVCLTVHQN